MRILRILVVGRKGGSALDDGQSPGFLEGGGEEAAALEGGVEVVGDGRFVFGAFFAAGHGDAGR